MFGQGISHEPPRACNPPLLLCAQNKAKGREAFKAGRYGEAVEFLTKALDQEDIYSVLLTRSQAHVKQGQYREALRDAQAMTGIKPTTPTGYLLQAQLLQTLHRYTSQVDAYEEGLRVCDREDDQYGLLERGLHDARQMSKSLLNDPRMMELFVLFDTDKDSVVGFREVALGLYQLTDQMQEAQRQAAALLLMMDHDDKRVLTYDKFAKLIMAFSGASATPLEELNKRLKEVHSDQNTRPVSQEMLDELHVTPNEPSPRSVADQGKEANKTLDALSYSRTSKLFDLWDLDKSGTIDFQELLAGLRKYQRAITSKVYANSETTANKANLLADVERDALNLMGHDQDSNQELDKGEFAVAMANYAEAIHIDLHELIDFMCVVSSQSETSEYETMYSDVFSSSQQQKALRGGNKFQQSLGTILDMGGDADEEDEDDW
jgi:Ca2+-binding EF-hand superfamily protein